MKRSGSADLPLHYGYVPQWLAERMARLGLAITEVLLSEYGKVEVLRRLSDPFWFQSLGAVMGMDWHSSGITTSVMGALKRAINPHSRQLGIYICGGKGKFSRQPADFEELLLLEGVGPRTLQSLALVSEVIHGAPARVKDPARFAFAHGGKGGHPFPVPIQVYDETISIMQTAVQKAKMGQSDKQDAFRKLHALAGRAEKDFIPSGNVEEWIEKEKEDSWKYGGRTVFGKVLPPAGESKGRQLRLF